MSTRASNISTSLAIIKEKILNAIEARSINGIRRNVQLVAVSKTKPLDDIMIAYNQGQRVFGENYIQELIEKANAAPKDITWHFIGKLQSNKCKLLSCIESLVVETIDSKSKADAMNKVWNHSKPLGVYIQINTSNEQSKGGIAGEECINVARHILTNCSKLKLLGLMTIGAFDRDPLLPNPDFIELLKYAKLVKDDLNIDMELSMGMSDDFEQAILLGSTNVRVGSKIFGDRS